eukprot:6189257-Pleurochrysis_carterae.AAC.6
MWQRVGVYSCGRSTTRLAGSNVTHRKGQEANGAETNGAGRGGAGRKISERTTPREEYGRAQPSHPAAERARDGKAAGRAGWEGCW